MRVMHVTALQLITAAAPADDFSAFVDTHKSSQAPMLAHILEGMRLELEAVRADKIAVAPRQETFHESPQAGVVSSETASTSPVKRNDELESAPPRPDFNRTGPEPSENMGAPFRGLYGGCVVVASVWLFFFVASHFCPVPQSQAWSCAGSIEHLRGQVANEIIKRPGMSPRTSAGTPPRSPCTPRTGFDGLIPPNHHDLHQQNVKRQEHMKNDPRF